MLIVGEKINTSRRSISEAVEKRDADFIAGVAADQASAGADYIDVNAGTFLERETDCLCWLVDVVQKAVKLPLCLDSPNPEALASALERHRGEAMINSISLEPDRFKAMMPVVTSRPCRVVALCMAETSMPATVEERVEVGSELIGRLTAGGVPLEKIYVDPLIQPVSVDTRMGLAALEAIRSVMTRFPGAHTICGLSNISFGLPERKLINRNFLALCMAYGLSAAILDPTDRRIMAAIAAVEMLLGRDEYCGRFIEAYQNGILGEGRAAKKEP
jgi:5-methyltetrahydrofolate corrinoid/iron sulfur protein methyltransferase